MANARFDVVPGAGFGPLKLGYPVNVCIDILRGMVAGTFDILFGEFGTVDLVVRVPELGLQLRFEPHSQRLRVVDVFDLTKLLMNYAGRTFGGSVGGTTLRALYALFGPTFLGTHEGDTYLLQYRGLCFAFPIPGGLRRLYTANLPIELPDGSSPLASRLFLFCGSDLCAPALPPLPPRLSHFFEVVEILPASRSFTFSHRHRSVRLGSSLQEVLSELGPPCQLHYKEEDKMRIHANATAVAGGSVDDDPNACFVSHDYFLNYFQLGLDLLFDAGSHTVAKLVVHTNPPGHASFHLYNKCNFRCVLPRNAVFDSTKQIEGNETKREQTGAEVVCVTADMRWSDVEAALGGCGRPMIHDSGSRESPFGTTSCTTFLYALDGVVFEVMGDDRIASLTLFN